MARRARLREVVAQQRALGLDRKAGTDALHVPEAAEQPVRLLPGVDSPAGRGGRGFAGRGGDGGGWRGRGRGRFDGGRSGGGRFPGCGRFARGRGGRFANSRGGGRFGPPGGRFGPPPSAYANGGDAYAHANGAGGKRPAGDGGAAAGAHAAKRPRTGGDADAPAASVEGLAELMAYGSDSEPDDAPGAGAGAPPSSRGAAADAQPMQNGGVHNAGRGRTGGRGGSRGRGNIGADGHGPRGGRGRGPGRGGRGGRGGRSGHPKPSPARRPTLLQKLLAPDVRREHSALLQCMRFFAANAFLADPAAVRFPEDAPAAPPLREQLLGPGAHFGCCVPARAHWKEPEPGEMVSVCVTPSGAHASTFATHASFWAAALSARHIHENELVEVRSTKTTG